MKTAFKIIPLLVNIRNYLMPNFKFSMVNILSEQLHLLVDLMVYYSDKHLTQDYYTPVTVYQAHSL